MQTPAIAAADGNATRYALGLARREPTRRQAADPDPCRRRTARPRRRGLSPRGARVLDEFALRGDDRLRAEAIEQRPELGGDPRHDAYLGALAEHLAAVHQLTQPAWSVEPQRFLDRFWFLSETPGFRAVSIAQAPAAFRRRGVFVPERSLHRV